MSNLLPSRSLCGVVTWIVWGMIAQTVSAQQSPSESAGVLLQGYCFDCHSEQHAEAGVDLEEMLRESSFAIKFRDWRKVMKQLDTGEMPPASAEQLSPSQRRELTSFVRHELRSVAEKHAGDPGPSIIRRLTSAEYAHTIHDLTGLNIGLTNGTVSDAVGGEGFTNAGVAQFVQDSTLELYLETANHIAEHAVIGTGPIRFYQDPGQTGLELSAINRIQDIYRRHGFRQAAGEGAIAYGLERYPQAFYAMWRFRFRGQLGLEERTLAELAAAEGVEERFAEYLWSVFNSDVQSFPTSEIISAWKELPAPASDDIEFQKNVRKKCQELFQKLDDWHSRLGINSDNKEDAPVIRTETFTLSPTQAFDMNINWPEGTQTAHIQLLVESANGDENTNPGVIWHKPTLSFNTPDAPAKPAELLRRVLSQEDLDRLGFGTHPHGGTIGPDDFVTLANEPRTFRLQIPEGARSARLSLTAELDDTFGEDSIVRCSITQREETDQGKSLSALLANSERPGFDRWRAGVLEFAKLLPPISHREPAPSDRDPIPPPFDGSYNNPERNHFHVRIKYHRDDQFLVDNILDNKTREELDHAWSDLLGSFEYHDAWLQFVSDKFGLDLNGRRVATLDPAWIENLPQEPREYVQNLHREYKVIQKSFRSAEVGHVEDMLEFASRAWRRQLKDEEKVRLRSFYDELRTDSELQHDAAIRVLLTRILLAPDFLYRAERSSESDDEVPLSDWELASRLSYFLWSSLPDTELRNIAASGELTDPDVLVAQTRRMLSDNKSRRFATEFFGQWFGFYRFNNYSGIDPQRFPEFTETLKSAMYDEAILFFDHIVREDRPVQEILSADYSFLNQDLAEHYGVDIDVALSDRFERVERANHFDRGGVLSLGAVLTLTSAPLRTSPVKRGDWVLRRVLGTPVPPPPPDVGSISSDDQPGDGLSVRERLEAHRREESCANCHSRIDPLGFALEQFDPIGRLRREYRNGTEIDTSGILRDGTEIDDFAALNEYVVSQRDLFYENLCTKLLGYALGRSVMIGDTFLIEEMMADLKSGAGMSKLVERIVNSRQFRYCGTRD